MLAPKPTKPLVRSEDKEYYVDVDADVTKLRSLVPALCESTDDEIECMWSWFSTTHMCAGWHGVPDSFDGLLKFFERVVCYSTKHEQEHMWDFL